MCPYGWFSKIWSHISTFKNTLKQGSKVAYSPVYTCAFVFLTCTILKCSIRACELVIALYIVLSIVLISTTIGDLYIYLHIIYNGKVAFLVDFTTLSLINYTVTLETKNIVQSWDCYLYLANSFITFLSGARLL